MSTAVAPGGAADRAPGGASGGRTAVRVARAAAVAAAVAYSLWVVEFALPTGIDPGLSFVSELSAADAPFGDVFRGADRAAGVLAVVCGVIGLAVGAGRDRAEGGKRDLWTPVLWLALIVFGAATFADSFLPMDCAVSADAACAAAERAGELSAVHTAHAYSSSIAGTAGIVGVAALALRERHGRAWALGWVLLAVQVAAMVAVLALLAVGDGQPVDGFGIAQRVQIGAVAAWLLAVGLLPGPWRRAPGSARKA
ncbi:hypothetical protein HNR23_003639 [Nocardiopsis mwathae]|uniref:DUF998 domain-containing protein n=1 Tax=Nocardiopsis mwathae TaxID=1472723 RepID=A0A7W9YK90_9ACTN|nr:hypothetical protein [Nocardiopsis mwathae]